MLGKLIKSYFFLIFFSYASVEGSSFSEYCVLFKADRNVTHLSSPHYFFFKYNKSHLATVYNSILKLLKKI